MAAVNDRKYQLQVSAVRYRDGMVHDYDKGKRSNYKTFEAALKQGEELFGSYDNPFWALNGVRIVNRITREVLWEVNC